MISTFSRPCDTTPNGNTTVHNFITDVKAGTWAADIAAVRAGAPKANLPCVTISGTFHPTRAAANIQTHSGFICLDIDHDTDGGSLRSDPYIFALFKSASGNGLAAIVRVKPEFHKESFEWLAQHFYDNHGKTLDRAPQNIASLRYVSHDPDLYYNERAKIAPFKTKADPKPKPHVGDPIDCLSRVVEAVNQRGIDFAPDYHTFYRVGCALVSHLGEAGRATFHDLCRHSFKYNPQDADRQYTICLNSSRGDITIGTLFYYAQQHGINYYPPPPSAPPTSAYVAPAPQAAVMPVGGGRIAEICNYINALHKFERNEITRQLEVDGRPITKETENTIYLSAKLQWEKVTKTDVCAYIYSSHIPSYNPFIRFLATPYPHDGTALDAYVQTIRSNTPNAHTYIRKWLIGIGAAVDGRVVRSVLCLIGMKNYTGKTEWFRRILPEPLRPYFGEDSLDRDKDSELLMSQKLILLDDEMSGKTRQDEKKFKELASKDTFSLREPYGHHNVDLKRLAVLCGTSNDHQILNDPTGNSRVLPVEIDSIDNDTVNSIDKTALFHDIWAAYQRGEAFNLTQAERDELQDTSTQFSLADIEADLIDRYFEPGPDLHTATDVKVYIESMSGQKNLGAKRIGIHLRKHFERGNKDKRYGYFMRKIGQY